VAGTRTRLSLVEYGQPIDLCSEVSKATGLDRLHAEQLLLNSGARVARSLGFSSNPIVVDAKGVRATDFAGLIRLGPSLELEIAPKFLGLDDDDSRWREDFFFLSTLSKHGCLLAGEKISSSGGAPRDLATLVAKSLVEMYESLKRRPIRTYRRAKENDFFWTGILTQQIWYFPIPMVLNRT